MKKNILKILTNCFSVLAVIAFAGLMGCSNPDNPLLDGLTEVKITTSVESFDFKNGVSFNNAEGVELPFEVDDSEVKFGKEGCYYATYTVNGDAKFDRKVLIYGNPTIVREESSISYRKTVNADFSGIVKALDTFENELKVELISELEFGSDGALLTGKRKFTFKTVDELYNETVEEIELKVKEPTDEFDFNKNISVDYAKPYYNLKLDGRQVKSVFFGGEKLLEGYIFSNDYLMFTPSLIKKLGVSSDNVLKVNCDTGSFDIKLTITDNQPVRFNISEDLSDKSFYLDDKISLPRFSLIGGSIQNVNFEYYLQKNQESPVAYSDTVFYPINGGNYSFITKVIKNGELSETYTQNFTVSHFCRKLLPVYEYMALGKTTDIALKTDLTDLDVAYKIENNDGGIVSLVGTELKCLKEGTVKISVSINGEEKESIVSTVVDFKNNIGSARILSDDINMWNSYTDKNIPAYELNVADSRGGADKSYAFNAITGNGFYLKHGLVDAAKSLGCEYLTFYMKVNAKDKKEEKYSIISLSMELTEEKVLKSGENDNKWAYFSIKLADIKEDYAILFKTDAEKLCIADARFVGADISEYAGAIIGSVNSEGKSADMIDQNLIGKMFNATDNLNNSMIYEVRNREESKSNDPKAQELYVEDCIIFERSGFYSSYGTSINTLYISSDWIMCALSMGYRSVGIWFNDCEEMSLLKRSIDGSLHTYGTSKDTTAWHSKFEHWGFLSIDLSTYEKGDDLLITIGGDSVEITGITFRDSRFIPTLIVQK